MTTLSTAVADVLVTNMQDLSNSEVTNTHLARFEDGIDRWFEAEAIARKFLIPCAILPRHASKFSVGPVQFFSISDLAVREGVQPRDLSESLNYSSLIQAMSERSAVWFAELELTGLDETVGTERANLAVDVALVAIQMSLPIDCSREISRITGRTMPPAIGTFFSTEHSIHSGITNRQPGLVISPEFFLQAMSIRAPLIESVGRRVQAYVQGARSLPKLEQAWSDAAFWLHEGLAEPLSTVAFAKLETSVEVLLTAESSKGSTARFREAFGAFYGLKGSDTIREGDQQTVNGFIKSIVGARSRVLHGTSSTLSPNTSTTDQVDRATLEILSLDLIAKFTIALDGYANYPGAFDDTKSFLEWVTKDRLSKIA